MYLFFLILLSSFWAMFILVLTMIACLCQHDLHPPLEHKHFFFPLIMTVITRLDFILGCPTVFDFLLKVVSIQYIHSIIQSVLNRQQLFLSYKFTFELLNLCQDIFLSAVVIHVDHMAKECQPFPDDIQVGSIFSSVIIRVIMKQYEIKQL